MDPISENADDFIRQIDPDSNTRLENLATIVSDNFDADIIFYNGTMNRQGASKLINEVKNNKLRKNVVLILITSGGSPDAAYIISRHLQKSYERFIVSIPSWCKSAGTLLAIGAHDIYMGDNAEMGPLDVQLSVSDELFEYSSGLTYSAAIQNLTQTASDIFNHITVSIKSQSRGRVKFTTASEIASQIASSLLLPIFSQIDPLKIGENSRSMKVAWEYGRRLAARSKNLSDDSLFTLVQGYPTHGFVIDRAEAMTLFDRVFDVAIDQELSQIPECFGERGRLPIDDGPPEIQFVGVGDIRELDTKLGAKHESEPKA